MGEVQAFNLLWPFIVENAILFVAAYILRDKISRFLNSDLYQQVESMDVIQKKRQPNYGKIESLERDVTDLKEDNKEIRTELEKEVALSHERDKKNEAGLIKQGEQLIEMNNNLIKINTTLQERLPPIKHD